MRGDSNDILLYIAVNVDMKTKEKSEDLALFIHSYDSQPRTALE